MKKTAPVLILSLLVSMMAFVASAATSTQVVREAHLETETDRFVVDATSDKWFFYNDVGDLIDNSLGSFAWGPAAPPSGLGSVTMSVTGMERFNLATYQFRGTPLASITELGFSTYNPSAGNGGSVNRSAYLNFNVDFDASDTWQRRLFFVPANNGTVVQDTWQAWDAIAEGDALWGWSFFAGNGNQWPDGHPDALRTWDSILQAFPDARIRATDAWFGIRVGEPYESGYTEYIDAVVFGTDSGTTVFDFEPDYAYACLFAGSLSQVGSSSPSCGRGTAVILESGDDLYACLFGGSLSQVGFSEPKCGRGEVVSFAVGSDFFGCVFGGSLSQVGTNTPSCGRGTLVGIAGSYPAN